jgi:hypothetical protein
VRFGLSLMTVTRTSTAGSPSFGADPARLSAARG